MPSLLLTNSSALLRGKWSFRSLHEFQGSDVKSISESITVASHDFQHIMWLRRKRWVWDTSNITQKLPRMDWAFVSYNAALTVRFCINRMLEIYVVLRKRVLRKNIIDLFDNKVEILRLKFVTEPRQTRPHFHAFSIIFIDTHGCYSYLHGCSFSVLPNTPTTTTTTVRAQTLSRWCVITDAAQVRPPSLLQHRRQCPATHCPTEAGEPFSRTC